MIANRKVVRKAFASLLESQLKGSLVQEVFSYRVGDLKGQTPVIVVSSSGSSQTQLTFSGTRPSHQLQIDVFVLYSDGTGWTEAEAEDRVDDIIEAVGSIISNSQVYENRWESISIAPSERMDVTVAGVDYIRETLELTFE